MAEPYLNEIRIFGFGFAPSGWAKCDGALLMIQQNEALFALLGTNYGGDGLVNYALPDMRGRVPIGFAPTHPYGSSGGEASHTLTSTELPAHTHGLRANGSAAATGNSNTPSASTVLGRSIGHPSSGADFAVNMYSSVTNANLGTAGGMIPAAGGAMPHENRQPYLGVNFCIAVAGIYPSRN